MLLVLKVHNTKLNSTPAINEPLRIVASPSLSRVSDHSLNYFENTDGSHQIICVRIGVGDCTYQRPTKGVDYTH